LISPLSARTSTMITSMFCLSTSLTVASVRTGYFRTSWGPSLGAWCALILNWLALLACLSVLIWQDVTEGWIDDWVLTGQAFTTGRKTQAETVNWNASQKYVPI
jgi:hypothetical protein